MDIKCVDSPASGLWHGDYLVFSDSAEPNADICDDTGILDHAVFCMVKLQPGSRQWHFRFHEFAGMGWYGLPDWVQPALPDLVPVLALIMRQTPA